MPVSESLQLGPRSLDSASVLVEPQLCLTLTEYSTERSKRGLFGFQVFCSVPTRELHSFLSKIVLFLLQLKKKFGDVDGSEFRRVQLISLLAGEQFSSGILNKNNKLNLAMKWDHFKI